MTEIAPRRGRGRPKGTGIDDSGFLRLISRKLYENPKLTVTGAIKMLGVTNESAIRRLRDKYKAVESS